MSINSVAIAGNLTKDAEVRQTDSGMMVMNMTVAVSERKRNPQTKEWEDSPVFVDVTLFDRNSSLQWMTQYLTKGFKVMVLGRLDTDKWQDKDTGQPRSKLKVIASNIDANWPKREQQGYQPQTAGYAQSQQAYQQQQPQAAPQYQQTVPQQAPQYQQAAPQQQYQQTPQYQQPVQQPEMPNHDSFMSDIPFGG